MKELKYLDITKTNQGHIKVPSVVEMYPDMGAGRAEAIVTNIHDTDLVPYVFRKTPFRSTRETDKLVGVSVPWNQLISNGDFDGTTGWSKNNANWSASNNVLSLTPTATSSFIFQNLNTDAVANHKYFASAYLTSPVATTNTKLRLYNRTGSAYDCEALFAVPANTRTNVAAIFSASSSYQSRFYFYPDSPASTTATYLVDSIVMIDLTLALGSTIADYIYTLESGTAGAGIAKLREWGFFTKPYYAYNAGGIESVNVSKHKMVGRNLIKFRSDISWGTNNGIKYEDAGNGEIYISGTATALSSLNLTLSTIGKDIFIGGQTYRFKLFNAPTGVSLQVYFDGVSGGYSANHTYTAPNTFSTAYMRIRIASGTAITGKVKISPMASLGTSDPEFYEPYEVHEYPLADITLRGILKLDGSNNLYADGDVYESDGTHKTNYGEITLNGTEPWVAGSVSNSFYTPLNAMKKLLTYNGEMQATVFVAEDNGFRSGTEYGVTGYKDSGNSYAGQNWLYLRVDGVTSTSALQTYLQSNPIKVVYPLATPTTETADPYTEVQVCSPYGTEEYVDRAVAAGTRDVAIPCGHNTEYMKNIVGAIEGIPLPPTTNGNYKLRCTVASGVPTYSWVSE